jgi:hypothetical protein
MRELALVFAFCLALLSLAYCIHPNEQNAAETAYAAEQIACVEVAKTLEESKSCRDRVRERWGLKKLEGGAP